MTDTTSAIIRRYEIDWLRILGVLLLIPFYTARQGKMVFEMAATEMDFVRNTDWEAGALAGTWCSAGCCALSSRIMTPASVLSATTRRKRRLHRGDSRGFDRR